MLLFELDFEEVSKKKLRECWSQLCRIRCTVAPPQQPSYLRYGALYKHVLASSIIIPPTPSALQHHCNTPTDPHPAHDNLRELSS